MLGFLKTIPHFHILLLSYSLFLKGISLLNYLYKIISYLTRINKMAITVNLLVYSIDRELIDPRSRSYLAVPDCCMTATPTVHLVWYPFSPSQLVSPKPVFASAIFYTAVWVSSWLEPVTPRSNRPKTAFWTWVKKIVRSNSLQLLWDRDSKVPSGWACSNPKSAYRQSSTIIFSYETVRFMPSECVWWWTGYSSWVPRTPEKSYLRQSINDTNATRFWSAGNASLWASFLVDAESIWHSLSE